MCSWAQRDQTDTWTREVNSEEVENTVNINILYFQDVFIIIHFIFQVLVNKTRFISAHHDDIINRGHKNNTNMLLHQNFFSKNSSVNHGKQTLGYWGFKKCFDLNMKIM